MDLAAALRWWQDRLIPRDGRLLSKIECQLFGNKTFSYYLFGVFCACTLSAASKDSGLKLLAALRLVVALACCYGMTLYFAISSQAVHALFGSTAEVAQDIFAGGAFRPFEVRDVLRPIFRQSIVVCLYPKADASKLFKRMRLAYRMAHLYGISASVSLVLPVILQGKLLLEMWPWFDGELGVWLGMVLQAATGYPACVPCFLGIVITISVSETLRMLCLIVATQLRGAETVFQVQEAARRHAALCALIGKARTLLEFPNSALTFTFLFVPGVSTVLVARGAFDGFCLPSVPYVVIFFTLCLGGQRLEEATEELAEAGYAACGQSPLDRENGKFSKNGRVAGPSVAAGRPSKPGPCRTELPALRSGV
ncbi:uncharacterized protein LOC127750274 isoform X2 [Frankliniella occidentalis]|uniref:Uncharacterized protein LOC127750274 isoform X2 n=1 Tax=Frankliniella occidentalis TaxID=133901 RepID=A0A9C6XQF4_FRAOC|nr:uncharacterized protein LOC127750274 isoform X2 [Frankliniella occidentalis]